MGEVNDLKCLVGGNATGEWESGLFENPLGLGQSFGIVDLGIDTEGEDVEARLLEGLCLFRKFLEFIEAVRAPGGPEIEEDPTLRSVGESLRFSFEIEIGNCRKGERSFEMGDGRGAGLFGGSWLGFGD